MRRHLIRKTALLLAIALLVPFIWSKEAAVASAATATPSLTKTSLTFKEIGDTYDINIKNKVAKSKYKWSTSDNTIAKVTSAGLVTAVNPGTATIKCKITYPSKGTKTLSCKVTVTVPATGIIINEVKKVNNAYQLPLNGTVDLEATISPANSTDKMFWYIDKSNVLSDPTCISLDANNQGIVTGLKAGKAVVRVRAAATATQAAADKSSIDDSIIIEVVPPSATVKDANFTSSNQLTVIFDSPVQKNTVINTDGTLSPNITISLIKTNNVMADDPGKLTAALSSDNLTLTVTSANSFKGKYGIHFTKNILTTTNLAIDDYYTEKQYLDLTPPTCSETTYDDTGLIATIPFSEPIDITNLSVQASIAGSSAVSPTTLSIMGNKSNYVLSADKKSLTVNLTNISASDYNKPFLVTLGGIKDLAGNTPVSSIVAYIKVDTSPKAQAQLISLIRTGQKTLTATFNKAIMTPGLIQVTNGVAVPGVVDTTDSKKVNYTISDYEATYTGVKPVQIGYWSSYNVIPTDTSAQQFTTRYVDFTVETTSPTVTAQDFDPATNILTLTYTEGVTLAAPSGTLTAVLSTPTADIINGLNVAYTTVIHSLGDNIVKLKLTFTDTRTGTYAFTLPQGFARDSFNNQSIAKTVSISNAAAATELPGPYSITQSSSNLKEITLMFANKLDIATATNPANYKVQGVTVLAAELRSNTSTGAMVVLTVQTIDATIERTVTINGVKGYNDSFSAINNYTAQALFKENIPPVCNANPIFDSSAKNVIRLNFSEAIQGSLAVTVTQVVGTTSNVVSSTVTVSGNSVYITLSSIPVNGSYLRFTIDSNNITDLAGNVATFNTTTMGVLASY